MDSSTRKYPSADQYSEGLYDLGLRSIYRPPDRNIEISIVAIHGLEAMSPRTWVVKNEITGKETNWLEDEDMLPQAVATAEIYTYNWTAYFMQPTFQEALSEHAYLLLHKLQIEHHLADRPIIFIASCFGGLILAEALLIAAEHSSPYNIISRTTSGIVFLATPFLDSSVVRVARWGASFDNVMGKGSYQTLARRLQWGWGKEPLERLKEEFQLLVTGPAPMPLYCYYETVEGGLLQGDLPKTMSRATQTILVDGESGTLFGHGRKSRAVSHSLMNKFKGPEDQEYQVLKDIIVDFVRGAGGVVRDRPDEIGQDGASTASASQKSRSSNFPGPLVREGTATMTRSEYGTIFSSRGGESTLATDTPTMLAEDETGTVYSDTMTLSGSTRESYATELCEQLVLPILPNGPTQEALRGLADVLPEYLRAFALRLGSSYQGVSRDQGDIMTFVHKYREYISETFMDKYEQEAKREQPADSHGMQLNDIMNMWYSHDEHIPAPVGPSDMGIVPWREEWDPGDDETAMDGDVLPTASRDEEYSVRADDDEVAHRLPNLGAYRESILAAPAYQWLISDIETQLRLMPSAPDASGVIRRDIFRAFPKVRHLSRSSRPRQSRIVYTVPWDPSLFYKDQEYSEEAPESLAKAITLTGSTSVAQALTTSHYLRQAWPSSGQDILQLIQALLRDMPGTRLRKTLSDGAVVTAWFETSGELRQTSFVAECIGTAYTLAELGEQLTWIGAALRPSQYSDGVATVQARIKSLRVIRDNSKLPGDGYLAEVACKLAFTVSPPPPKTSGDGSNGECWHSLFRNPVLVRGFPVARRANELRLATGLEIPLYMMARLAKSRVLNSFCGRTVLKGFSTLLVPTRRHGGMILWHLIHDEYGDRVSYLESLQEAHIDQIPIEEIQKARHILGWCSRALFLAGTASAKYDVISSRLPRARTGSLLQQASVSGGQVISGGEPFSVGYKDSPPHISRMGYIRKLKWISRRLVILWDVDTKRGWLLNGTTALLHLVRASLEHDSKDKFSSQFLFQAHDMEEAPQRAACGSDSAIDVLLSDLNRKLRIYPEKDGYIYFEDRVEHLHGLLAQMIDHQDHALRSYDARSANLSRASLEGWDFRDLVSDMDPVHPRTITLGTLGMAWIELARSLNAITLVGRGFGEIIKPAKQSCPQWTTLPIGKYYLAVSATDLMDIMDAVGDATAVPPRLTDDLVWLNTLPVTPSGFCRGGGQCTDDHVDVVQVLLPPNVNRALKKTYTCPPEDGAVVFGHNENVPWFWKETGHPVYGTPDKLQPVLPSSSSDSGYGLTRESESDSTRPTSPPASIQGGTAPSTTGLRVPLVATKVKLGRRTFSLDAYTVGIVCALPLELFAVRALFDVTHAGKDGIITPSDDSNHYALGEIGKHKVVAACLPDGEYGTNSAADVVTNMKRTFTSVKFALLVGIGGGVPSPANDIRLGDVVVSRPTGTSPGVIQYDMGKAREDGVFTQVGYLQPPPRFIMTALSNLRSDPLLSATPLQGPLDDIAACRREYRYPGKDLDRLFTSDYPHDPVLYTCNSCDMRCLQPRANRPDTKNKNHHPRIHYGTIASGNRVVRDAKFRDHWSKQSNILCFEMEAAGIMNTVPCLVIRGICDYSDSHKNKVFQHYAAAAAASYAKLLLSYVKSARDPDGVVRAEIVEKRKHFKGLRRAFKDSLHIFARS